MTDKMVHHPPHYNAYSIEVIEVTRHCSFDIGNAIKYMLRHLFKNSSKQDLEKALWYLRDFVNHPKAQKGRDAVPHNAIDNLHTLCDDYLAAGGLEGVYLALKLIGNNRVHAAMDHLSKEIRQHD